MDELIDDLEAKYADVEEDETSDDSCSRRCGRPPSRASRGRNRCATPAWPPTWRARAPPSPGEPVMPKGLEWNMLSKDERERLRGLSKEHAENIGLHISLRSPSRRSPSRWKLRRSPSRRSSRRKSLRSPRWKSRRWPLPWLLWPLRSPHTGRTAGTGRTIPASARATASARAKAADRSTAAAPSTATACATSTCIHGACRHGG